MDPVITHRVRYVECDSQRVMHNSHYLALVDDVLDTWLRARLGDDLEEQGYEVMVKRAEVTWSSPARLGDAVDLGVEVTRWGNTSMNVLVTGTVGERAVFTADVTHVRVDPETWAATPFTERERAILSG